MQTFPTSWLELTSESTSTNPQPARQAFRDGGRVQPTEAQKQAGNYRKERMTFQGLPISVETKKGQARSGIGADGNAWSVKMPADYGYIRKTEGADGDHVDCYIGPDADAPRVWVIDQVDPKTRIFDEHKLMLGFKSRGHAELTYRAGFSDGKGGRRIGAITEMTVPQLKAWLQDRAKTQEPMYSADGERPGFAGGGSVQDPWAEFRVQPAQVAAPADDPWAEFRIAPSAPAQAAPGTARADPWSEFPVAPAPRASFDERFGNGPMSPVLEKPGVVEDVAKTVPSALARGTAGLIGLPGLISQGADWLADQSAGRVENLIRGKGFVAPTSEERAARTKEVDALRAQSSAGSIGQPPPHAARSRCRINRRGSACCLRFHASGEREPAADGR